MEVVGARFGRSSTRYTTTSAVFNGPVRRWKKKWTHIYPSPNNTAASNHHSLSTATRNGTSTNGDNGSHLLIYKWTPISQSQNNNNDGDNSTATNATSDAEELPRRKFKYVPIAVLEQKNEAAEEVDDEAKPSDTDSNVAEPISKNDGLDGKPNMNDVPMEESQAPDDAAPDDAPLTRQDLNEGTLDLSLGFNDDSESKIDQNNGGQLQRVDSSSGGT